MWNFHHKSKPCLLTHTASIRGVPLHVKTFHRWLPWSNFIHKNLVVQLYRPRCRAENALVLYFKGSLPQHRTKSTHARLNFAIHVAVNWTQKLVRCHLLLKTGVATLDCKQESRVCLKTVFDHAVSISICSFPEPWPKAWHVFFSENKIASFVFDTAYQKKKTDSVSCGQL